MKVEMLLLIRQIMRSSQKPKIIAMHRQMTMPTRMMHKLTPMMTRRMEKNHLIQQLIRQTTIQETIQIRPLVKVTQETQLPQIPLQKMKKTQPLQPQQRKSLANHPA
jgi:hypothetical protein